MSPFLRKSSKNPRSFNISEISFFFSNFVGMGTKKSMSLVLTEELYDESLK